MVAATTQWGQPIVNNSPDLRGLLPRRAKWLLRRRGIRHRQSGASVSSKPEARGDKRVAFAQHVAAHLDAYLSATQLGITLASLALGWLGESFVAELMEPFSALVGITSPAVIELERLVGEIQDEFDAEQPELQRINENEFSVPGSYSLHDLGALTGDYVVTVAQGNDRRIERLHFVKTKGRPDPR